MKRKKDSHKIIRLKDIAAVLNLSVSTVSKALQDSHEISQKTKDLILAYATANHYIPNPIARSLKGGRSKTIGILISTIDNNFFAQVINGIESVAYERGYNIFICQTQESTERELTYLQNLSSLHIDGLIISLSSKTQNLDYLKQLQDSGVEIVLFDRITDELSTHKVICDNFIGSYNATAHLIHTGHTQIAHIAGSAKLSITKDRLEGYKTALKDNDIQINNDYIRFCTHSGRDINEVMTAINELLSLPKMPQAIFGASDRITIKSLEIFKRLQLQIPENLAFLGFTNTDLHHILDPSLTIVRQPAFEMGKKAIEIVIDSVNSKYPVEEYKTYAFQTELIIGNSTAKIRAL